MHVHGGDGELDRNDYDSELPGLVRARGFDLLHFSKLLQARCDLFAQNFHGQGLFHFRSEQLDESWIFFRKQKVEEFPGAHGGRRNGLRRRAERNREEERTAAREHLEISISLSANACRSARGVHRTSLRSASDLRKRSPLWRSA